MNMFIIFSSPEPLGSQGELIVYPLSRRPSVVRPSVHHFQRSSSLTLFFQVLYILCLYEAQISGERLQDHWSSGINVVFNGRSPIQTQNRCRANFSWVCVCLHYKVNSFDQDQMARDAATDNGLHCLHWNIQIN